MTFSWTSSYQQASFMSNMWPPTSYIRDLQQEATRTRSHSGLRDSITFIHNPLGHIQSPAPPSCSPELVECLLTRKLLQREVVWVGGQPITRTDNHRSMWLVGEQILMESCSCEMNCPGRQDHGWHQSSWSHAALGAGGSWAQSDVLCRSFVSWQLTIQDVSSGQIRGKGRCGSVPAGSQTESPLVVASSDGQRCHLSSWLEG